MRLSVSTKIFLGFAVVIVAFGAACAYTIYRMNTIRASVTLTWQDVVPISSKIKSLARRVRAPEEFLGLQRPTDAQWLQQLLASLRPFAQIEEIEADLDRVAESTALTPDDARLLLSVRHKLTAFRAGTDLVSALVGEGVEELPLDMASTNAEVFERLVRRTVKLANEGRLADYSPEARAITRALRRINRELSESVREIENTIRELDGRTASDEKAATLAVIVIGAGALVLSLVMLLIGQLTLAPIRKLRISARRIAAGNYDERVQVGSRDEIGQLAEEFDRMAEALRARDIQLARQREELLRRDRLATIGKVAAQITHEIRNPLSSIGLNAELLEEEIESNLTEDEAAEAHAILDAIAAEVQRLKAITEQYLRYARLPSPETEPVDLAELVRQLLTFLSHELVSAGIELETDLPDPDAPDAPDAIVRADADQIRQVLLNISRNAIEALADQPEPRQIRITVRREGGSGKVTIIDNGPGIDPELRDRIFEPFVSGKSVGTGLGLAVSQQIVTQHGGTIAAESPAESGRGTAFTISLPGASGRESGDIPRKPPAAG